MLEASKRVVSPITSRVSLRGGLFVRRIIATIVDVWFIYLLVFPSVLLGTMIGLFLSPDGHIPVDGWLEGIVLGIPFALTLLFSRVYSWYLHWQWGRTFGKLATGLEVRMTDGRPCTFDGALIRSLTWLFECYTFWSLPMLAPILSTERDQRLGDVLGGTVVERTGDSD